MFTSRPGRRAACTGAVALSAAVVLLGAAAPASAKSGDVVKRAACSGASVTKLKLSAEGSRMETELEVDSNRTGQRWSVGLYRIGTKVASTTAVTRAPSGSFSVRRLVSNGAGRETVKGLATNSSTGEVCRVAARF
jgi:hypothetical protein